MGNSSRTGFPGSLAAVAHRLSPNIILLYYLMAQGLATLFCAQGLLMLYHTFVSR